MQDITYLKQVDRLKNEFVNTVSHDLRSPLTAILGYVDLLERVGPVNDQQREFIHRVQVSVESITSLVNDLLELGRIEAGFDSQNEIVPLEGILRYSLETVGWTDFGKTPEHRTLTCQWIFPRYVETQSACARCWITWSETQSNTHPRVAILPSKWKCKSEQVILRISDNGPGIPPADQPHIFEKFYRASNVPKGVGGSGLGLAIVKSIVDSHQGRIWVESLLGQGIDVYGGSASHPKDHRLTRAEYPLSKDAQARPVRFLDSSSR